MPEDMHSDTTVHITDGQPVMLPGHDVIADAQFTRAGADLFLSTPDGYTVKVEGYFNHNPPPALDTPDGKHLSPSMVSAFLAPAHPAQYADAAHGATANDASPVGKITQVVGKAEIIHPDGTHSAATLNAAVHQGDVIQTADKGGVNILFVDNTTFAISENARMSVDEFTYHPADHSGSTFFSMLQGMFVYTSGLIGKHDPGHVNIDTPVGSIGIRGTVVAGDIHPAGQDSHITIVDGAIVVTNDGGSVQLDHTFGTAVLHDFSSAPTNAGQLSAQGFTSTYDGVHSVAASTFDAVSDGTYHVTPPTPTPDTGTDPTHGMLQLPGDIITNPDVQQAPQTGSTFDHGTAGFSDGAASGFDATTGAATGAVQTATADDGARPTGTTATDANASNLSTTSPTATDHIKLDFSSWYQHDGGIPLFNLTLPGQAEAPTTTLATVTGPAGTDHFVLTMSSNVVDHSTGSPVYGTHLANGITDVLTVGPATGGTATIDINNIYAMTSYANPGGLTFTLEAYNGTTLLSSQQFTAAFDTSVLHGTPDNIYVGDASAADLSTISFVTDGMTDDPLGNDLLYNRTGNDHITSTGGYDTMIGGTGDETFTLATPHYQYIYGGGGTDTLIISGGSDVDMSTQHNVYDIEALKMNNMANNTLTLTLQDVLNMVGDGGHLEITTDGSGTGVETVHVVSDSNFSIDTNTGGTTGTARTVTGTAASNGATVTLVIHNDDGGGHGAITSTVG